MDLSESTIANSILFVGALVLCALFSFLETSITALRLFKLKELAQKLGRYRELFVSLEQTPTHLLNTMLVANTLASTTAATAGTFLVDRAFASLPTSISFALSILVVTAAILIFGEIIPKNIAKMHGEHYFQSTLWLTNLLFYTLYPFVRLLIHLSNFMIGIFVGLPTERDGFVTSEKEIQFLINYIDEKGLMEREKTTMLRSVFDLGTTPVKEIMIPATAVVTIGAHQSVADAFKLFTDHQFSRLPVYECDKNNIIGMLYFKDLVPLITNAHAQLIKTIIRPILFIPETIKVNQLLKEFKERHVHIAMVVHEYGSVVGLVTLEDVLEEIVGEIHDEYEAVTSKIVPLDPSGWLIEACVSLKELEEVLHISFETEGSSTLGGFLAERLQHLPKKGERLSYKKYTFQVQQAEGKKTQQVLTFEEPAALHIEG